MKKAWPGRLVIYFAVAVLMVVGAGYGLAVEEKKPDATIKFETGSVAAGIGFSWGGGTLAYKGKTYQLKVSGMSVGKVGISKATAAGTVYNLKNLEDINGNYTGLGAAATVGGGGGAVTMRNQNGVVLEVVATTKGVDIALGTGGVDVSLK